MSNIAPAKATYEDLLALPEGTYAELDDGVIVQFHSPLPRHNYVQRTLGRFVGGPFQDDDDLGGPGGWWILTEVDVEFDRFNAKRPDIAGWKKERLSAPWDIRPITVVPDWICEILSPSTSNNDRKQKPWLYSRYGVKHYWIIDPEECLIEVFELQDGKWIWLSTWGRDDHEARIPPFEAIRLDIERLFPPLPKV